MSRPTLSPSCADVIKPPMVAIAGPTASGKSSLAHQLALEIGGEIVNCDSVQVYQGFDLGSAKATKKEQQQVPYHLLDILHWNDEFDAENYRQVATDAIKAILARGNTPILCGGTGLYLRVLRWGIIDTPKSNLLFREKMEQLERQTQGYLRKRLEEVDPESAQQIEGNNLVRIIRALDIYAQTGKPASAIRQRHAFLKEQIPMTVFTLGRSITNQHQRIEQRTHQLIENGFIKEVEGLLKEGVELECKPMCSVGYKQVSTMLRGELTEAALPDKIISATKRYARRQRTWFRKERSVIPLPMEGVLDPLQTILTHLKTTC